MDVAIRANGVVPADECKRQHVHFCAVRHLGSCSNEGRVHLGKEEERGGLSVAAYVV